jgi:hypothetical protein
MGGTEESGVKQPTEFRTTEMDVNALEKKRPPLLNFSEQAKRMRDFFV